MSVSPPQPVPGTNAENLAETLAGTLERIDLGPVGAFAERVPTAAQGRGWKLLVTRDDQTVAVVENRCSHAATRLDTGRVKDGAVSCPLHGARFDLRSGACLSGPATRDLPCFDARLENDRVVVELPQRPGPRKPGPFR